MAHPKSPRFEESPLSYYCEALDEGKNVRLFLYHLWSGASLAFRQTLDQDQRIELCIPEKYYNQRYDILQEAIHDVELDFPGFFWEDL